MATEPKQQDRLLTAIEVGQLLGLSRAGVYAAARSGRIPSVRLWGARRKTVRFRRSSIETFVASRETAAREVGP